MTKRPCLCWAVSPDRGLDICERDTILLSTGGTEQPMSDRKLSTREDADVLLEEELKEPRRFRVLLHNDDYTSMDFVVAVLIDIFRKSREQAMSIMLSVHEKGIGVCGVYTAEVAETKVAMVHARARAEGFPLRCSMEEV